MRKTYQILKTELNDLPELLDVARKAFLQAFTAKNKPENVNAYLEEAFTLVQFKI
jgi:diamine N-acetyltransferase